MEGDNNTTNNREEGSGAATEADLGRLVERQSLDCRGVLITRAGVCRDLVVNNVVVEEMKRLECVKQEVAHEFVEVCDQCPTIERVGHSATIHRLTDQVPARPTMCHIYAHTHMHVCRGWRDRSEPHGRVSSFLSNVLVR